MSAQAKLAQLQKLQAAEQMASRCGLAAFPARPYRGLCPIVQSGAICLIAVFRARSGACASCTSGHRRRHQDVIMPLDENGHPKLLVYKCDWTAPRAPHCVALLLDIFEALESVNRAIAGAGTSQPHRPSRCAECGLRPPPPAPMLSWQRWAPARSRQSPSRRRRRRTRRRPHPRKSRDRHGGPKIGSQSSAPHSRQSRRLSGRWHGRRGIGRW